MKVQKKITIINNELTLEASIAATGNQGIVYTFFNNDADSYVTSQGHKILEKLNDGTLHARHDTDSVVRWKYKIHVEQPTQPSLPKKKSSRKKGK